MLLNHVTIIYSTQITIVIYYSFIKVLFRLRVLKYIHSFIHRRCRIYWMTNCCLYEPSHHGWTEQKLFENLKRSDLEIGWKSNDSSFLTKCVIVFFLTYFRAKRLRGDIIIRAVQKSDRECYCEIYFD